MIKKEYTNLEIAELLRSVAAAYQFRDEAKNKFKIIAYERAADAIEHSSSELKDLWDEGKLEDVPGVGKSIAAHLDELFKSGKVNHFESLMKAFSPQIFRLLKVPGIGPKTALKLVQSGEISKEVKESLQKIEKAPKRYLLPYAEHLASEIIAWMKKNSAVARIDPLGSLRRKASTVGDIDLAVATNQSTGVIEHFCQYPKVRKVLEKGENTASILLPGDVQIDLMVQEQASYGALLQHFTGSKHHNIALREYALRQGLSLSEYGIRQIKDQKSKVKKFRTEEEFYQALGLECIPPELREDAGEIEASLSKKLPHLIELEQVKADLQIHSSFDIETSHDLGESSMEEIIKVAGDLGYEYLAFTEHNPSRSKHTDKQIVEILKRKREKVEQLNYSGVRKVFNSLELDILPNGSCPIPLEGFAYLDFALISIHSSFGLPRDKMTKRVIEALSWHPKARILAHPTTRKLNEREGIELNWPEIFAYCQKHDKWLEINADPMRLDLPDFLVREAIKSKVKLTLGTDAHHQDHLKNMTYGVSVARRGWAEKNDIINTRSLEEFKRMIGGD
jgi:DNA polymerase (family 10)